MEQFEQHTKHCTGVPVEKMQEVVSQNNFFWGWTSWFTFSISVSKEYIEKENSLFEMREKKKLFYIENNMRGWQIVTTLYSILWFWNMEWSCNCI